MRLRHMGVRTRPLMRHSLGGVGDFMKLFVCMLLAANVAGQSAPSGRPHVSGETKAEPHSIVTTGYSTQEVAAKRLIEIMTANRVPLGIVLNPELCKERLDDLKGSVSLERLAEIVSRDVPGYEAAINQGVLRLNPRTPPGPTEQLLSLKLPQYVTATHETHKSAGATLHSYVKAQLVPGQGSSYEILGSVEEPTIDQIRLQDVSVETALNYIATRSPGAVWIMTPIDQGWMSRANTMPFNIQGYTPKPSHIHYVDYCDSFSKNQQSK